MYTCTKCGSLLAKDMNIPVSPVPALIDTNAVLSPTEEGAIRAVFLDMNSDLSQLDGEIDRVRAILHALQTKREALSDACSQYSYLLSPIRRLPHEILGEIFLLSISNDKNFDNNRRFLIYNFRRAVMRPASVCQYWRNVALSTPRLWSSISIFLQETTANADVELARTWITRSGNVPLSIKLHGGWHPVQSGIITHAMHSIIDVLTKHAERWECVDFQIPYAMLLRTRPAENRLVHLRSLAIGIFDYLELTTPMDIFEVAPRMSALTMRHPPVLDFRFPWTQLTSFNNIDTEFTIAQCYDMFFGAPNLVECHLSLYDPEPDHPPRILIRHTHLRTFHFCTCTSPGPLFDFLSFPALRCFNFKHVDEPWAQSQFLAFLSRSSCPLEKFALSLEVLVVDDDDFIDCLRCMPTIVHLEFYCQASNSMGEKIFSQLTFPPSTLDSERANCLVPNLKALRLTFSNGIVCPAAFVDMVESRRRPSNINANVSLLRTLQLHAADFPAGLTLSQASRLKDCVNGGLDVQRIRCGYSHNETAIPWPRDDW